MRTSGIILLEEPNKDIGPHRTGYCFGYRATCYTDATVNDLTPHYGAAGFSVSFIEFLRFFIVVPTRQTPFECYVGGVYRQPVKGSGMRDWFKQFLVQDPTKAKRPWIED